MRPLQAICGGVAGLALTGIVPDLITVQIPFMMVADHPVEIPQLPLRPFDPFTTYRFDLIPGELTETCSGGYKKTGNGYCAICVMGFYYICSNNLSFN